MRKGTHRTPRSMPFVKDPIIAPHVFLLSYLRYHNQTSPQQSPDDNRDLGTLDSDLGFNGRGEKTIPRGIFSFAAVLAGTPPRFFKRLYRMSHPSFMILAEKIALFDDCKFRKSYPLQRISVTLRWLAGGSYLDIALAHNISTSAVYYYIDETMRAIDGSLDLTFPYRDETWLKEVSEGFSEAGRSALDMCCGALDGIAVKITEPAAWKVANSSSYYNRKGWFALNVLTMCDSKYRFTFMSCKCPGSTHDNTAFALSGLSRLLERGEGGLLAGFWIAADDAYKCMNRLLTSWPDKALSVAKDYYNHWKFSARINIEQSSGMLVWRWGVFWRPLKCTVAKNATIISVCCKLHNFIIDTEDNVDIPVPSGAGVGHHTEPEDRQIYLQDDCDLNEALHRRHRDLESSQLHHDFTVEIAVSGRRRACI